jgi:diguanylate cyclase (GGDEF)-like protein/PAS domain S-box-containing protein
VRHWSVYLRFTLATLVLLLGIATLQQQMVYGRVIGYSYFIAPATVGTIAGLLIATLVLMRRQVAEGQRKFRAVADLAQEFVYIRRVDGSYEYVSPSCLSLTGYSTETFYAQPSFMNSLIHPEDLPRWLGHVHQMDSRGQAEKLVLRIRTKAGEERWIEHLCSDLRDEQGRILGVRATNLDITDRVLHERELALAAVAFETREAILITDNSGHILRVNKAFTQVTGFAPQEVIGRTPSILKSGRHDDQFYADMWQTLKRDGCWSGEMWDRRKNGEIYPKHLTITAVAGPGAGAEYYVGTFSDITARKAAEEEINRLAFYDPLTRLPNRRLLIDRLHQARGASDRSGFHGAILFIDLDHFKRLNDTRGHDIGDRLLIDVATRLQSCIRTEDTVARLGGDEFVVMLEDLDTDAAEAATKVETVANKILCALNQPYYLKGRYYEGSSSIGVTLFRGQDASVDDLLRQADVALYRAKDSGRGAVCFFDPEMQALLNARAELETDLRNAIARRELCLYYQPQVDARGRVFGAEALLRWLHPQRGMVAPGEFIPFAEECGLIVPMGRWVIETACAQLKSWESRPLTRELQLAVNISAHQFLQDDFVEETLHLVHASRIAPARLKLELTESALIDNLDAAIEKIRTLKAAGIGLSLDDFGTGYSSLAYLRHLPLDQLKIDRSFVSDVTSENGAAIARTIIDMGRNLGLGVIAEGVETLEQYEFLDRHGCHCYQGYLFSRPLPATDFEQLLHETNGVQAAFTLVSY